MQQIKGSVLKGRLHYIEEHWGRDAIQQVLAALPAADAAKLRLVLTLKWYPFALGEALDEAIVSVLGNGDTGVFDKLGEASAETNLSTVHRSFLTPGRPQAFMAKAPQIFQLYYEQGHRTYEQTGEHSGVLTTYDAEVFSAPDCLTVIGWYRKALTMCGATEVRIEHPQCRAKGADVCRYALSWASPA